MRVPFGNDEVLVDCLSFLERDFSFVHCPPRLLRFEIPGPHIMVSNYLLFWLLQRIPITGCWPPIRFRESDVRIVLFSVTWKIRPFHFTFHPFGHFDSHVSEPLSSGSSCRPSRTLRLLKESLLGYIIEQCIFPPDERANMEEHSSESMKRSIVPTCFLFVCLFVVIIIIFFYVVAHRPQPFRYATFGINSGTGVIKPECLARPSASRVF